MKAHDRATHPASLTRRTGPRAHRMFAAGLAVVTCAWVDVVLALQPAEATGPTCRGLQATIVGSSANADVQTRLRGTAGDDVVVTNGARVVTTGAGSDTICVTLAPSGASGRRSAVFPGGGDDVVDSSVLPSVAYMATDVGAGHDLVVGGPGMEHVEACYGWAPDTISTAGGNDWVHVCEKRAPDTVDMGEDDDVVLLADPQGPHGHLVAGPGDNRLVLVGGDLLASDTWAIDLASRTSTFNGVSPFSWDSFSRLVSLGMPSALAVTGTDGRDDVIVLPSLLDEPASTVMLDLRGGEDRLQVYDGAFGDGSRVDLGADRDLLQVTASGWLDIDLHDRTLAGAGAQRTPLLGVEDVRARAERLRISGDGGDNTIGARGCHVVVRGREGADSITVDGYPQRPFRCRGGLHRAEGGRGDDVLRGSPDVDRLLGGPGNDWAYGAPGFDRCVAEQRIHCEV